jgi:hypothetical protein
VFTEDELAKLVGQELPAGTYRIDPVESLMLTSVVHGEPTQTPHPIYAFVAAQTGIGISVGELLASFGTVPEDGPMLGECELTTSVPFVAGIDYTVTGSVTSAIRKRGRVLGTFDLVTIELQVHDPASTVISTCRETFVLPRREDPDHD